MVATLYGVPHRSHRGAGWIAALALLVLGIAACAAPTLPLPPPTALAEAPDASGIVTVRGNARAGVFVGCLNERTESGVLVRADTLTGDYVLQIPAEIADALTVWQFEGSDPGGMATTVVVPAM
jgi:multidrug efflux pump subunit AcrA (membrane-fusion protein)